jgi:hypothetical protein
MNSVGALVAGIGTAAGMARAERLKANPGEERPGSKDRAYALEFTKADVGASLADGSVVLDLHVNTQLGQQMNLYVIAPRSAVPACRWWALNAAGSPASTARRAATPAKVSPVAASVVDAVTQREILVES